MSLPKPFSFTIPSIYDDTIIDCRLYHPPRKRRESSVVSTTAAIIAHPYAPLGGSQDDGAVHKIGLTLLKKRFLVGTFNFRGAHGSNGRTSWSAKPELADYVSFYGFILCYLSCFNANDSISEGDGVLREGRDLLVLGGYSYGSLIAQSLPSPDTVVSLFTSPSVGSAQAEIWLRAQDLARIYLQSVEEARQSDEQPGRGRHSLRSSHGVVVGGYESEATSRRISRDSSRRSLDFDGVRRSMDRLRHRSGAWTSTRTQSSNEIMAHTIKTPRIAYLLVSPLLQPVTTFLSLSTKLKLPSGLAPHTDEPPDQKLRQYPSCVVFGGHDIFTSHKRLRKWVSRVREESSPPTQFKFFEVEAAGHFWNDPAAEEGLKKALTDWIETL